MSDRSPLIVRNKPDVVLNKSIEWSLHVLQEANCISIKNADENGYAKLKLNVKDISYSVLKKSEKMIQEIMPCSFEIKGDYVIYTIRID